MAKKTTKPRAPRAKKTTKPRAPRAKKTTKPRAPRAKKAPAEKKPRAPRAAKAPATPKPVVEKKTDGTGRGSPEAIQKRRVARRLNDLLTGGAEAAGYDGRTAKRRTRLLGELSKKPNLQPIQVLQHVAALHKDGMVGSTIRAALKEGKRSMLLATVDPSSLGDVHKAYGFAPQVYAYLGAPAPFLAALGFTKPKVGRPRKVSSDDAPVTAENLGEGNGEEE